MPRKFKVEKTIEITSPNDPDSAIVKVGKQSGEQRYRDGTGKKFRDPNVYVKGGRFPHQQVGAALGWYFDGLSYREVARNMARTFEIPEPGEATIYRWVQSYARGAVKAVKDLKANTGDEWVADETMVKVDGHPYWIWNVMDSKTRYLLAMHLTPDRDVRAATRVMREAKDAAASPPKSIRTDRLKSYGPAIKAVFGTGNVAHIKTDGIAAEVNNNLSERLQGTIKERDKVLRGFKRASTAQDYLGGWKLDYNYFRPHHAIGKRTPASLAKVEAPFNNWQGVAQTITAKGAASKSMRPVDTPGFKAKKKLGRPSTKRRGRARPTHEDKLPTQKSLDLGKK